MEQQIHRNRGQHDTVNGGQGPFFHDADANRFGHLLFRCFQQEQPSRVCGGATVAPDPPRQSHFPISSLDFPLEGPGRRATVLRVPVSAVCLWNNLLTRSHTACGFAVAASCFMVMVVLADVHKTTGASINVVAGTRRFPAGRTMDRSDP